MHLNTTLSVETLLAGISKMYIEIALQRDLLVTQTQGELCSETVPRQIFNVRL